MTLIQEVRGGLVSLAKMVNFTIIAENENFCEEYLSSFYSSLLKLSLILGVSKKSSEFTFDVQVI